MEIISSIQKYWTVIVAFAGILISYANLKSQNIEQEKRILHLEAKSELAEGVQHQIQVSLAEIQLDLKWIKQSLNNK